MHKNKEIKSEKNALLDIARGCAIVLVVFGHCIQCGSGDIYFSKARFFDNIVFKAIYSFHMPLFMLVSGYLFYGTNCKRSFGKIFLGKVKSLLIPILAWNLLYNIRTLQFMDFFNWLKYYWTITSGSFWFLWVVFFASILSAMIERCGKNKLWIYPVFFGLSFIIPDQHNLELFKFMYPFFFLGFLFAQYKDKISVDLKILLPVSGMSWLLLLLFYNYESYIYTSGWYVLGNIKVLLIDIYRIVIGVMGSTFVLLLWRAITEKYVPNTKGFIIIRSLGENSLGIYIITSYLNGILRVLTTENHYNIIFTILETILMLTIALLGTVLLKQTKYTSKIFLGGR